MIEVRRNEQGIKEIRIKGDAIELAADVLSLIHHIRNHMIENSDDAIPAMLFTNGIILGLTSPDSPMHKEETPCSTNSQN